jgi:hypothetical protein
MTSARVAAAQARRELAFLEVCESYQERLEAAKAALQAAREQGDVPAEVSAELRAAADEMRGFREWARTVGRPRDGGPGDAVIRVGG